MHFRENLARVKANIGSAWAHARRRAVIVPNSSDPCWFKCLFLNGERVVSRLRSLQWILSRKNF